MPKDPADSKKMKAFLLATATVGPELPDFDKVDQRMIMMRMIFCRPSADAGLASACNHDKKQQGI